MITDRDLDAELAAANDIRDEDLPTLPESFLETLRNHSAGARSGALAAPLRAIGDEPASVVAARQLADEAHAGDRSSRRPRRRIMLRVGAGVLALAAAWAVAVVITPAERPGTPDRPTVTSGSADPGVIDAGDLGLVAAEQVTFPLSLDPPPPGLVPLFSRSGGIPFSSDPPLQFLADYSSADGDRVMVYLHPEDPRTFGRELEGESAGTVQVGQATAEVFRGDGEAEVLWERPDGRWVEVLGEGRYGTTSALLPVAASVVDRPQPLDLQFGLAPAGWHVGGYEESRTVSLVSDTQPDQLLQLSLWGPGGHGPVDAALEGVALTGPVEPVTIQGEPGRLGLGDPDGGACACWYVVGQFPGADVVFVLMGTDGLTREQMLAMAEQVTYRP
jgi:hypothetical protein